MASSNKKVRIALAGAGIFVTTKHLPGLLALKEKVDIVAVYSRSQDSATKVANLIPTHTPKVYFGDQFEEMLKRDDVDAVDLVLPIDKLISSVDLALQHGKHVISEKPVAPTVKDGQEFLEKYNREYKPKGLVWTVAENFFYEPAFLLAAELVQNKKALGKVQHLTATRITAMNPSNKYFHTTWRQTPSYQGGFVFDAGVHDAAIMRLVVGEIDAAFSFTAQNSEDLPPMDTVSASLKFKNGVIGTWNLCFNAASFQVVEAAEPPSIVLVGSAGSMRVWPYKVELVTPAPDVAGNQSANIQVFPVANHAGQTAVTKELSEFADAVAFALKKPGAPEHSRLYSAAQALQDVAVLEAVIQSSASNTPQKVIKIVE